MYFIVYKNYKEKGNRPISEIYKFNLDSKKSLKVYSEPYVEVGDPALYSSKKEIVVARRSSKDINNTFNLYTKSLVNKELTRLTNSDISDDWDPFILEDWSTIIYASYYDASAKQDSGSEFEYNINFNNPTSGKVSVLKYLCY